MFAAIRKAGMAAAAVAAVAALATGVGTVVATPDADAAMQATATTGLNVRSGPGLKYRVIGSLRTGQKAAIAGSGKDGWTPITYAGHQAWVSSQYVKVSTIAADKSQLRNQETAASAAIGTRWTTTAVNVRTDASINSTVVTVLPKAAAVQITGVTRSGYSQVSYLGKNRWMWSGYLSKTQPGTKAPTSSTPQSPSSTKTTVGIATADLIIRSTYTANYTSLGEIAKGSKLALTGVIKNQRAQIVLKGKLRWVNNNYVRPEGPSATAGNLPKVTAYKYATVALDIRSASKNSYTLTEVPAGTRLALTGVYADGRAQVIYSNAVRWVTAKYLSNTPPVVSSGSSKGLAGLRPSTAYLLARVQAQFPQIVTYYGVRPDSLPDHPSGRALDCMIPNYRSAAGRALGQSLAEWARAHAQELNIEYIIWNQHIWNVKRDAEGWRYMADRGGDTANHKDHVHITELN